MNRKRTSRNKKVPSIQESVTRMEETLYDLVLRDENFEIARI